MPENPAAAPYRKQGLHAGQLRKFLAPFFYLVLSSVWNSHAADTGPRVLEGLRPSHIDIENTRRVASTLQKMRRNFVLENTRGEREVTLYKQAAPSVVYIETPDGFGSGVVIGEKGYILTNWHVVGNRSKVTVFLKPGNSADLRNTLQYSALVEKIDQIADLALLRIAVPPKTIPSLAIGDAGALAVGQDVHAIGHPKGEAWTYTKGIISQLWGNYEWKTDKGVLHRAHVIQTQTPINPGNSGGPLLDDGARLVGINSFRFTGDEGLNYAVSVDTVKQFLSTGANQVTQAPSSGSSQPQRESPAARPDLNFKCSEGYDGSRRGWNDIIGCYHGAVGPPPNVWFVFRTSNKSPTYAAIVSDTSEKLRRIDRFEKNLDANWKNTELYVDTDCNGFVDIILTGVNGTEVSSRLAPPQLQMTSLTKEIDMALKNGSIPHRNLRVCQ
jgi:S1-C subfamily serine protease